MPHTKSAWKRLRQTEKRRKHNRVVIKGVKKQLREVADALKSGDATKTETEIRTAATKLDKAAARGQIHKNKAARLKSRMAKKLNVLKNPPAAS
jgi:small subunit ribosomal protein S20